MRVDDEGRVTIPAQLLEALGLLPGDEMAVTVVDDHLELRKQSTGRVDGRHLTQQMWGSVEPGLTTDEVMRLTRGSR